jgi:poly(A) polymerase
MTTDATTPRQFALEVVRRLRGADFEAYWAGGCVRDGLLGREPKDYDVATSATPDQIRTLFGRRRTLPLGAAFGVITILGPPQAGPVEVATFRQDATYSDGRHPDSVRFSSAQEDAQRRDFTVNGLFYDPVADQVIDYVGGRQDIDRRVIRAVGDPLQRFTEDKLRMLRAVRFSAAYEFSLEPKTFEAIRRMAPEINVVSPERISMEMQRILVDQNRASGMRLLRHTELAAVILPEVVANDEQPGPEFERTMQVIDRFDHPEFPLVLAALLHNRVDAADAEKVCLRWRLSNRQTDRVIWLVENHLALEGIRNKPWSESQKLLVSEGIDDLLALSEAECRVAGVETPDIDWCRSQLERSAQELNPPPLLTGTDLISHGVEPGPNYAILLQRVRDAQLDEEIGTRQEALALVDRISAKSGGAEN